MNKDKIKEIWLRNLDTESEWFHIEGYIDSDGWCNNFNKCYSTNDKFDIIIESQEPWGTKFRPKEFKLLESKTDWDQRFIDLAEYIGNWSKDRSTKVGAVIVDDDKRVVGMGYNGFPAGFDDEIDSRHERPVKYAYTEHAERNAIFTAARNGSHIKGCTMYLKWFPCVDCARAIIQSGIKRVVCTKPDFDDVRWGHSFKVSHELLVECGVELTYKS